MTSRILFASVIGFLGGVFFRSFIPLGLAAPMLLGVVAVALAVLVPLGFLRRGVAIIAVVAIAGCALGMLRMQQSVLVADPELAAVLGREVVIGGTVVEDPDIRDGSTRIILLAESLDGRDVVEDAQRVLVALPPFSEVALGDRLEVHGVLAVPEPFNTTTGRSFDYPGYLAARGVLFELSRAHIEMREPGTASVLGLLVSLRRRYIAGTQAVLPEPHAGLASGIVAGDKRSVGKEVADEFSRVSLTHMLVLSGYNITIVASAVGKMLSFASPLVAALGSAGGIILFVLATGASASASRAAVMALIGLFALLSKRRFLALRALALASAGMVAWNPYLLVFDPGFQLSVLATIGLIVFSEPLACKLSFVPARYGLREITATTIATQITVLPLLLWQSGNLSFVALPANLLALIVVPGAMLTSFVASLGGMLAGPLATPLALPAYLLLSYILGVARVFAAVPGAAATMPAFSAWVLVPVYAVITLAAVRLHTKPAAAEPRLEGEKQA